MDSKAECVQLNLAHVARKKSKKNKLKQTKNEVDRHSAKTIISVIVLPSTGIKGFKRSYCSDGFV